MYDYIFRAEALGWNVLVADPNVNSIDDSPIRGSQCPQFHLQTGLFVFFSSLVSILLLILLCPSMAAAYRPMQRIMRNDGGTFLRVSSGCSLFVSTLLSPLTATREYCLHSGPNAVHLLKAEPSARERIVALALTDGTAIHAPGTLLKETVPTARQVESSAKPDAMRKVGGLQVQQVFFVCTYTGLSLSALCTWNPTTTEAAADANVRRLCTW
jgi:hypothetical protein